MVLSEGAIKVVILSSIFAALAIVALAFRLWSRHIMKTTLQFNDYAAIIAMVNPQFQSIYRIIRCANILQIFAAGTASVFLTGELQRDLHLTGC